MTLPLYQVDAFTSVPFEGNPAGVCLLDGPRPDAWMQALAQEMNLSETAFLLAEGGGYNLRWFTPVTEVSLCGHATLASAHVLFESGRLAPGATAHFFSLSGVLTAVVLTEGKQGGHVPYRVLGEGPPLHNAQPPVFVGGDPRVASDLQGIPLMAENFSDRPWIELDFPADPVQAADPPPGLLAALGLDEKPRFVGRSQNAFLIELGSEPQLRRLAPDFARLKAMADMRSVIVTCAAQTPGYDFISRYFAPWIGINEDPVTGSAHTRLIPYWAGRLGKTSFSAYQASARGGELRLRLLGLRVGIAGQAVTVFSTELRA